MTHSFPQRRPADRAKMREQAASSVRAVHSASLYLLLRLSWVAIGDPLFAIGFVLLPMPQGKGTAQWRSARPGTCDGLPRGGLHLGANLSSGAPSDARVFAALFLLPEYRWPADRKNVVSGKSV